MRRSKTIHAVSAHPGADAALSTITDPGDPLPLGYRPCNSPSAH